MTISIASNALAIGQSVSSQYNGLSFDYDKITGRNASHDKNNHSLARLFNLLSTVKKYACGGNHTGNLRTGNHKRQLVRSKVRTKVCTKNAIIKKLFIKVRGKVRTENNPLKCELNGNKIATRISQPNKNNGKITALLYDSCQSIKKREKADYADAIKRGKALAKSANYLPVRLIFSRQALMTQAEKLLFSFCDNSSICFINSWGNRISLRFDLLFSLVGNIFKVRLNFKKYGHYTIKKINKKALTCRDIIFYIVVTRYRELNYIKQSPDSVGSTSRDLTKPLNEVMIMANRYDNAHPCAKQFKFFNIVTSQAIQIIATTYTEAKKQVNNDYVLTVRKPLNQGGCHE